MTKIPIADAAVYNMDRRWKSCLLAQVDIEECTHGEVALQHKTVLIEQQEGNVLSLLFDLRSLPCPVPPGFHRGLWTAPSEPPHRCLTLPRQRSTEPPTRKGRPTSGQNMAPMTRTEEEGEGVGWPTGTWLPDPQVRGPRVVSLRRLI